MDCGEDQLIEIEMMGCALLQFIGEMHQCIAYIQIIDSRIGRVYFDTICRTKWSAGCLTISR